MEFRKKPVGAKTWEFTLQAIFLGYCFFGRKKVSCNIRIQKSGEFALPVFCFAFVVFPWFVSVTPFSLSRAFLLGFCVRPPRQAHAHASTSCLLSAVRTSALRLDHLPEPMAFFLPFPWYVGVLREAFTSSCLMYFMYS